MEINYLMTKYIYSSTYEEHIYVKLTFKKSTYHINTWSLCTLFTLGYQEYQRTWQKALYKMHYVIRYLNLLPATHANIMKKTLNIRNKHIGLCPVKQ